MGRRKNFIENANMSMPVKFSKEGHKLNESFTLHKTSVMSYSQVANNFKFNKSLVDSKLYQLDMLPVMCMFDEDGKPTTHDVNQLAYGAVIPKTARWEMNEDGVEVLFVDTVLWNGRFEELDNIGNANQSMEINNIKGAYNRDERFYEVNDFDFSCLTILSETTSPAFKCARIDNEEFSDAFEKFKQEFSEALKSIDLTQYQKKGDDNVEENKDGATTETKDVTMATEATSQDVKIESDKEDETKTDDTSKTEDDENTEKEDESKEMKSDEDKDKASCEEKFEISHDDIRELLTKKLDTYDSNGYRNYDIWVQEVFDEYCIYSKWSEVNKYYKVAYTKSENDVVLGVQEEVFATYLTKSEMDLVEANKNKYEELSIKYSELETETRLLRKFKEEKVEEENKLKAEMELDKKNELINSFSEKLTKEEIDSVVTDINGQTFEEIKVALSVAFAEKSLSKKEDDNQAKFANIDTGNKAVSTKDKLLAELKARKQKPKY